METIKICVYNSDKNLAKLNYLNIFEDTPWTVFQLVEWASEYMETGEKPAEKCFTQRLDQVEINLNKLGLEYYRILKVEVNK